MHGALGCRPSSTLNTFVKWKRLASKNSPILLAINGDFKSFAKAVHCRGGGFFGRHLGAGGIGACSSQKLNRNQIQTSSTCEGGRVSA
jgi:hypothetical protein